MKKSFNFILGSFFLVGLLFTSCSSPSNKVENAGQNLTEAQEKLDEANRDYNKEVADYKELTAIKISANEKSIKDFNAQIADQKSEAKEEYKQKIAALDSKNSDLKKKLEDFNADNASSWESFRIEFGRDMDQLGIALRNFSKKDEK